jgi:hypothetical protein
VRPPKSGYGKNYAICWINVANNETMYSGAMTKEEAKRIVRTGHWHAKASPSVVALKRKAQ